MRSYRPPDLCLNASEGRIRSGDATAYVRKRVSKVKLLIGRFGRSGVRPSRRRRIRFPAVGARGGFVIAVGRAAGSRSVARQGSVEGRNEVRRFTAASSRLCHVPTSLAMLENRAQTPNGDYH